MIREDILRFTVNLKTLLSQVDCAPLCLYRHTTTRDMTRKSHTRAHKLLSIYVPNIHTPLASLRVSESSSITTSSCSSVVYLSFVLSRLQLHGPLCFDTISSQYCLIGHQASFQSALPPATFSVDSNGIPWQATYYYCGTFAYHLLDQKYLMDEEGANGVSMTS